MTDFSRIVQDQREFFAAGRTRDVDFRLAALRQLEQWIRANDIDIIRALKADLCKSPFEGYATEIGVVLDEIRFARRHLRGWSRPKTVLTTVKTFPSYGRIYADPYGVALIMSPWNYPFMLTVIPLVAAIAAGNCAVVKPSAYSAASSALIARMCQEVFEPGHVTVVRGGRQENQALLDQRYDVIFFTGSTAVGKRVMQAAARDLTPVTLELGGKSPCIVDETADLRLAAKRIVWGKFINAGQTCVAPDYVLVQASVKNELLKQMAATVKALYGDDPLHSDDYPKIINDKHFQRLLGLMDGLQPYAGGGFDPAKLKIEPTILDAVSWDAPVMGEEIFGPLLPVLTYDTQPEAVRLIGGLPKPLAAYLFSRSRTAVRYFMRHLEFGGGCVNDTVVHLSAPRLPFGGLGESGMGSYHGKAGFDAFTHHKSVLIASTRVDVALRYPPHSAMALRLLKRL